MLFFYLSTRKLELSVSVNTTLTSYRHIEIYTKHDSSAYSSALLPRGKLQAPLRSGIWKAKRTGMWKPAPASHWEIVVHIVQERRLSTPSNPLFLVFLADLCVQWKTICGWGWSFRQNKFRTSLRPLALIRGKVALVSGLIDGEQKGLFPPLLLNRKSTLDEDMA